MAGPPPSFSSFPEPSKPRPPPPTFASFPSPPRRTSSPPPAKRPRAAEFLDELGTDLGLGTSSARDRSSKREHRSSRRNESGDDDEARRRSRKGKEREREGDRDRDRDTERRHRSSRDKERERDKSYRRKDDERSSRRSRRDKERETERDSDYGPAVRHTRLGSSCDSSRASFPQRSKPYQLVQAPRGDDVPSVPHASTSADTAPSSEKPLYYESRRGDENNLRYGGLHRGDVPRYRRFGAGRIVGLNEGLRITKETAHTGRGVEVAPLNRFKAGL